MTTRRTPEQVHEQDGHPTLVASCSLCHPAEGEPVAGGSSAVIGESGPEPVSLAVGGQVIASASVQLGRDGHELVIPAPRRPRAGRCRNGCAAPGTHGGVCHDCHTRPQES